MANKLNDIGGAAKEVAAEILGDGELQEERKRQREKAKLSDIREESRKEPRPSPESPSENLHDLT